MKSKLPLLDKTRAGGHKIWNEIMAQRYDPDSFITQSGFPIRLMEKMRLAATIKMLDITK